MTKFFSWHFYHARTDALAATPRAGATARPANNNNGAPPVFRPADGLAPRVCKSRTLWNHRFILSSSKLTKDNEQPNLPALEPNAKIVKVREEETVANVRRVVVPDTSPEPVGRKTVPPAPPPPVQVFPPIAQQFVQLRANADRLIPKSTRVRVPPPMTSEIIEKIKDHVLQGLQNWDGSKDAKHEKYTYPLRQHHKLLALLMDGLYKHYFKGVFAPTDVPNDAVLRGLCKEVLETVPEEFNEEAERVVNSFQPNARETMRILYEKWEKLPELKDLAPDNRWRTLVDPIKVEMLGEQGINTDNPMLAFIFECAPRRERSYAYKGAKAWVAVAENLNKPFNADIVRKLHDANNGVGYTSEDRLQAFGTILTSKGAIPFIENLYRLLYRRQIDSKVEFKLSKYELDYSLRQDSGFSRVHLDVNTKGEYEKSFEDWRKMAENMQEKIKSSRTPEAMKVTVTRGDMLHTTSDEILEEIVGMYKERAANATTSDEKVNASNAMGLEGDRAHLYSYANLRTWLKNVYNLSLGQQQEKFAIFRDPVKCEGMSPEELLVAAREGQLLWNSWLKPELQGQQAGEPS